VRSIGTNAHSPDSGSSTKQALAPSFEDCLLVLKSNIFSPQEEISIRIEAWQISNHRRRDTADPIENEALEIENLTALRVLLEKEGGEVSHILAEILRELGHHEACQDLLVTLLAQNKHLLVLRLIELNRMQDRFVARVFEQP